MKTLPLLLFPLILPSQNTQNIQTENTQISQTPLKFSRPQNPSQNNQISQTPLKTIKSLKTSVCPNFQSQNTRHHFALILKGIDAVICPNLFYVVDVKM